MEKNETKKKVAFNKKKLKYGFIATAITIFFIAIVIFINLIAGNLTEEKGLKLDFTKQNIYSISQESLDYAKTIESDVEIAVMREKDSLETMVMGDDGKSIGKVILESLMKYQQNSDHIKVNFYDLQKNPDVVNKFKANYSGDITEDSIVISCGDRVEVLNMLEFVTLDTEYYYSSNGGIKITSYRGENEITPALMKVTDANPVNVAIIANSNSQPIYASNLSSSIEYMQSLLDSNGYFCDVVDIYKSDISPEDYDMVVLPAPATDLTEDCIKKLDDFLYNNGNLDKDMIYIADVLQRKMPNLDAFLEVWGIKIGDYAVLETDEQNQQQLIIERSTTGASYAPAPIVSISDETFSEGLSTTKLPIVAPVSRNIELLFDSNVDRTVKAVLSSSDSTVLQPIYKDESEKTGIEGEEASEETSETEETTAFDPESVEKSSNVVMALSTKSNMDSNDVKHQNNMLVVGSASFVDQYIGMTGLYNNTEFFVNAVNKICDKEANTLVIQEKNLESVALSITSNQLKIMQKIIIFAIPIVIAVCGVIVFIRRRNR